MKLHQHRDRYGRICGQLHPINAAHKVPSTFNGHVRDMLVRLAPKFGKIANCTVRPTWYMRMIKRGIYRDKSKDPELMV